MLGDAGSVPIRAIHVGDGTCSLAAATATFGGVDTAVLFAGVSGVVKVRAYDMNDGSGQYALAISETV